MKKKKVLFVVHQLNYGGVQKAALIALDSIDYSKYDVTLYVRKNRIPLISKVNENVKKIIVNKDNTHYYRKPKIVCYEICKFLANAVGCENWVNHFQQKIAEYINKAQMMYEKKAYFRDQEEYDIAISYIQGYTAKFVAEYINAKKKIMFYHVSTDENHEIHERAMPYYDKIVGVNKGVQDVLKELYPEFADKMTYIENYVDAEKVRRKSQEYQIEKKNVDIVLCTCGRLAPVKGFDLAIEAARILKENNTSFKWYFVGDGPERDKLERMIVKNTLTNHIEITGMLDNPYPYITNCDIYVQSSYEEAHPLAIIEALILNCPVVTTNTVGGKALIKEFLNGVIVEKDALLMAKAILQLQKDDNQNRKMQEYLKNINYLDAFNVYQEEWEKLLR